MMPSVHRYEAISAREFPPVAMRKDIACAPKDNYKFYPKTGKGRVTYSGARRLCGRCPDDARYECAMWAITTGQAHGFWGGLTVQERSQHPLWKTAGGDGGCDIYDDTSTKDSDSTAEGTSDDA